MSASGSTRSPARSTAATNSADTAAGIRAGLGALARFEPITMAVGLDGSCELMRAAQLFVVNMPLFGPGLRVSPDADPADGLLDVVALEGGGRLSLLSLAARLRRGTHLGRAGVRSYRAETVRISTRGALPRHRRHDEPRHRARSS